MRDLGVVLHLAKLLESTSRAVRSYAVLCLAILAVHCELTKSIECPCYHHHHHHTIFLQSSVCEANPVEDAVPSRATSDPEAGWLEM